MAMGNESTTAPVATSKLPTSNAHIPYWAGWLVGDQEGLERNSQSPIDFIAGNEL